MPQMGQVATGDRKDILGNVLSHVMISHASIGNPNNRCVVPPVKLTQTTHIAMAGRLD